MRVDRLIILALIGWHAVGCASRELSPTVEIPPGQYDAAFDAARDAIRFYGFKLERVDAAEGVITTRAKRTSGLATPWDLEQSSLGDEWSDFMNAQQRLVRVTFAPAGAFEDDSPRSQAAPGRAPADHREEAGPMRAEVEVTLERVNRPHWRIPPESVRRSTFARDPIGERRGLRRGYTVAMTQDRSLAGRLAERVRRAIAEADDAS